MVQFSIKKPLRSKAREYTTSSSNIQSSKFRSNRYLSNKWQFRAGNPSPSAILDNSQSIQARLSSRKDPSHKHPRLCQSHLKTRQQFRLIHIPIMFLPWASRFLATNLDRQSKLVRLSSTTQDLARAWRNLAWSWPLRRSTSSCRWAGKCFHHDIDFLFIL